MKYLILIVFFILVPLTSIFANSDDDKSSFTDSKDAKISLEVTPDMVKYGDYITIHASLPSYEKPDDLRYYIDVFDLDGRKVDSTLWFARTDFNYTMRTEHPSFNITRAGDYTIHVEKSFNIERTGEIVKTTLFTITTNPSPLEQIDRGISSQQVSCNEGLELVIKSSNSSPACVKPDSISRLIERGWIESIEYYNRQCENSPWNCSQEVPEGLVDLDKFKDDSLKQEILTQLRKEPKNLNDMAKEFILSEALSDNRVSDLVGDTKYKIFWTHNSELGKSSIRYSYGITFQLNEKDLVSVVYDLQQEKITLVEIGEVFGSSAAEDIPSDPFNQNQTNSIPLTLFPVTPQNVTLPDTTKQTLTFTDRISINKINLLKIINSDSTNGQNTHLAQLSINSVTLHTTDIENLPAKPGFDTLIFDYTIQSKDNDAFYAMLDFEVQVGSKKYPTLLNGGDFSEILLPDEKRDSYFAIQIGKDANQVILNVRDPITQKTLWSIPVDLKPFNIKYKPEEGILVQENEN